MTDLPKKIEPCPIKEAVFELRFKSDLPEDAVFGIIFNQFKQEYGNTAEALPILQIPSAVRSHDPNLRFSPHYKMQSDNFILQVGPTVLSLVNTKDYIGWDEFRKKIIDTFYRVKELNIINYIDRLALRYINIFQDSNIFQNSDIRILLNSEELQAESMNLSTQIIHNNVMSTMKMISGAQVLISDETIDGSLLDIDSSMEKITMDDFQSSLDLVRKEEKELFFKVIGEDYLKSMNPEYSS